MKTYVIEYRWQGQEYRTLLEARSERAARSIFSGKFGHVELLGCREAEL